VKPGRAKDISAGDGFCAALLEDNSLVTWGVGQSGEMGREMPDLKDSKIKKRITEIVPDVFLNPQPPLYHQPAIKRRIIDLACGGFHFLAVSKENGANSVYSTGLNQYGQLGHGDETNRSKLTKINALSGKDIVKVDAGYHFSCFLDKSGRGMYMCGRGDYGQLGTTLARPATGYFENTPLRVPFAYNNDPSSVQNPNVYSIKAECIEEDDQPEIEQVSCGSTHVLALCKGGDVYSWGYNDCDACGQKADPQQLAVCVDILRPKRMKGEVKASQGRVPYEA